MIDERGRVEELIRRAFADTPRPANGSLCDSVEGDEPALVEADFQDKDDWRTLDGAFLDQAPRGYASALSFFSDAAFRYFLPAYLVAHLRGQLDRVDVVGQLCHGLTDGSRSVLINALRYGNRTWFQAKSERYSGFTQAQAAAIAAFLEHEAPLAEFDSTGIEQALANYWRPRAKGLQPPERD